MVYRRTVLAVVLMALGMAVMIEPEALAASRGPDDAQATDGRSSAAVAPGYDGPAYVANEVLVSLRGDGGGDTRRRHGRLDRESMAADRRVIDEVARENGYVVLEHAPIARFARYRLPDGVGVDDAIAKLRTDHRVACAQPNYIYVTAGCPQDPALVDPATPAPPTPNQYGIFRTFLPSLWRANEGGAGEIIAIVDTGVDLTHPDLSPNLWTNGGEIPGNSMDDDENGYVDDVTGYDFYGSDSDPDDDDGHGSHCAGIAAARDNTVGIAGVAYRANIMALKVLNASGAGVSSDIAEGIAYAGLMGAGVINLSLTIAVTPADPEADCVVRDAVAEAYAGGTVIVGASGNGGGSPVSIPARWPEVIAVGAVDAAGVVTAFSQYGADLDVVAPGYEIYSASMSGDYYFESGTSQAAPFVSGICALLLAEFPGIRAWEIEAFLRTQTRDTDGRDPGEGGNQDGFGLVSFGTLRDYSDGALAPAWSQNAFFEWLGEEVTGESAMTDAAPPGVDDGDDDMPDLDGVTNAAGQDGGDDGLFPASFDNLPFKPKHLDTTPAPLTVSISVRDATGPRYVGPGGSLLVRSWADWNSNGVFSDASERIMSGTIVPGSDSFDAEFPDIKAVDTHMMGNPLRIRTRLTRSGDDADPGPTGAQKFGEVEDQEVLNFFEDFDGMGVYADMNAGMFPFGGWRTMADGSLGISHHGSGKFAEIDGRCEFVAHDITMVLPHPAGPPLDLTELTTCKLSFWVHHGVYYPPCGCGLGVPLFDDCRLAVLYTPPGGTEMEVTKPEWEIPPAATGCGDLGYTADKEIDLSEFCGGTIRIKFHKNLSDGICHLFIDDVAVWGYDDRRPETVAGVTGSIDPEARTAGVTWTEPDENDPPIAADPDGATSYDVRLWSGADSYDTAFRLTPRDFAAAGSAMPVPGSPGGAGGATHIIPSLLTTYAVGIKGGDEGPYASLEGIGGLDTSPTFEIALTTSPAVYHALPGDTVAIPLTTTNSADVLDAIASTASDSLDWIICNRRWTNVLEGGEGAIDTLKIAVPLVAADDDTDRVAIADTSLSDDSVTDSLIVLVVVAPPASCFHVTDHDIGNVRFTMTDQGALGFLPAQGSGFVFPKTGGANRLAIGGLLAGTSPSYLLSRDYTSDPNMDWVPAGCISETYDGGTGTETITGEYTDAGHPSPRGLRVQQTSYAWSVAADEDYVIVKYELENAGATTIEDLHVGPFLDWDLNVFGGAGNNRGAIDTARGLAYMWRPIGGDGAHVGVMALSHQPATQLTFVHNPTYVWPTDTMSDTDRYHFLAGDLPAYRVTSATPASDWSIVAGIGPFDLEPGATLAVGFAMIAGTSLADLQANADAAKARWVAMGSPVVRTDVPGAPEGVTVTRLELGDATPNPFRSGTSIRLALPASSEIALDVFDVQGRRVATPLSGAVAAGTHVVSWDGRDAKGEELAEGVYFVRLSAPEGVRTTKVILSK